VLGPDQQAIGHHGELKPELTRRIDRAVGLASRSTLATHPVALDPASSWLVSNALDPNRQHQSPE
jgi:hypothetical protein